MPFAKKEKDEIITEEHGERPIETLIPEEPTIPDALFGSKELEIPEILNEAKHETFLRLAKPRVQKILNSLRILGNCSNKSTYEYTEAEIFKIFNTIKEAIMETEAKFTAIVKQKELFEF